VRRNRLKTEMTSRSVVAGCAILAALAASAYQVRAALIPCSALLLGEAIARMTRPVQIPLSGPSAGASAI
jgi:hypothetical protein